MEHQDPTLPPTAPPHPPLAYRPAPEGTLLKTPGLAAMLSVFPGLGNIYNGLYLRGVTFFLIQVSIFGLAVNSKEDGELAVLVPAMIFFWFFNLFDAYRQATLINYGYTALPVEPMRRSTSGSLAAGLVLVVLGLFAILRQYFNVDLSWLLELWPFGILAFGGWLIWRSLKERQRPAATRETSYGDELS